MRTSAGKKGVSVIASIACLCVVVACGQTPLATPPPAVGFVSETATLPPLQVTVQAAETANAAAFTAEAQAQPRLAPVRVTLPGVNWRNGKYSTLRPGRRASGQRRATGCQGEVDSSLMSGILAKGVSIGSCSLFIDTHSQTS